MKVLNVEWFNKVGIVTIDNGYEIKTYIKDIKGFDEKQDIKDVITWGFRIYPEQLKHILKFHKNKEDEKNKKGDKNE